MEAATTVRLQAEMHGSSRQEAPGLGAQVRVGLKAWNPVMDLRLPRDQCGLSSLSPTLWFTKRSTVVHYASCLMPLGCENCK